MSRQAEVETEAMRANYLINKVEDSWKLSTTQRVNAARGAARCYAFHSAVSIRSAA
jgi:hypothetical protein